MSGINVCSDLMVEIFERLPSKSIIRFRSLSKYWHSRLATPEFIRNHRLRCSKNPPKLLIRYVVFRGDRGCKDIYALHPGDQLPLHIPGYRYLSIPKVEFPCSLMTMMVWDQFSVVGSCNGILCLRDYDNHNFSLWNLSIRRRVRVPRPPFISIVAAGFGFDPITDDYKIVAIDFDEHKTFVYSLKTESWSEVPSPSSRLYGSEKKPYFFNGILHWVVVPEDPHLSRFILTFNVSSHVFGRILFPGHWIVKQLTTINGCLALVSSEDCDSWKIRVMGEHGKTESWSLLFELKRDAFHWSAAFQRITNGDLVAYYKGTNSDLLVLYGGSKEVYNPQTRLLTKLFEYRPNCYKLEMDTYVESLELVDKESATTCGKTLWACYDC
ncbi:putative F-box domain-containing protein [Helianthus annuus]|uniref:putative F-box protein At3g16210 n=1 Tax=Helianthus annuus TaxID=4232 RepID=UPI000B9013AB|nr:putative F-box protein At3g16210 [Helianthus annuus]KAJ0881325.1 putative F-box domain-containing protein [Helianthus annuus]